MDDLELYAKKWWQFSGSTQHCENINDDIGMQFGLNKCAKVTFRIGQQVKSGNISVELEHNKSYKYLGINEAINGWMILYEITKQPTQLFAYKSFIYKNNQTKPSNKLIVSVTFSFVTNIPLYSKFWKLFDLVGFFGISTIVG